MEKMLSLFSYYFQTVTHNRAVLFLFWIMFLPQKLPKTDITDTMPHGKEGGGVMLVQNSVPSSIVLKKNPKLFWACENVLKNIFRILKYIW